MRFVLSIVLTLAGCSSPEAFQDTDAKTQILHSLNNLASATNEGDFDSAVSFYADTPDFYWVENGQIRYESVGEIEESLKAIVSNGMSVNVNYYDVQITMLTKNSAIASSKFESSFSQSANQSFKLEGVQTMGLIKVGDKWKILSGHTETTQ